MEFHGWERLCNFAEEPVSQEMLNSERSIFETILLSDKGVYLTHTTEELRRRGQRETEAEVSFKWYRTTNIITINFN